jgi:hypothetical protein
MSVVVVGGGRRCAWAEREGVLRDWGWASSVMGGRGSRRHSPRARTPHLAPPDPARRRRRRRFCHRRCHPARRQSCGRRRAWQGVPKSISHAGECSLLFRVTGGERRLVGTSSQTAGRVDRAVHKNGNEEGMSGEWSGLPA